MQDLNTCRQLRYQDPIKDSQGSGKAIVHHVLDLKHDGAPLSKSNWEEKNEWKEIIIIIKIIIIIIITIIIIIISIIVIIIIIIVIILTIIIIVIIIIILTLLLLPSMQLIWQSIGQPEWQKVSDCDPQVSPSD